MESVFLYYAFISYKREDEKWAKWLQDQLRWYKLPSKLCRTMAGLPKRAWPVFRDNTDLDIGPLAKNIREELEKSQYLIVICSPEATKSPWVGKEIEYFVEMGRSDKIIPFVVSGEPYSDDPEKECIHSKIKAFCKEELLVVNVNEQGNDSINTKKRRAFIRVVARLLDIKYNALWRPYERVLKIRRWSAGIAIGLSLAGLFCFWNYNRTRHEYYADYVERWGIPAGIVRLSNSQVKSRYNHFDFEYKQGKLQSVAYKNACGQLALDVSETNVYANFLSDKRFKIIFHYENDELISRDIYNIHNQLDIIERYSGKKKEIVDLQDSLFVNKSKKTEISLLGSISSLFIPDAYASFLIFEYRKLMLVNELSKYYKDSGISRLVYERNERGKIKKIHYKKDAWNEDKTSTDGSSGRAFDYDHRGRIIGVKNIFPSGDSLYKNHELHYDEFGNVDEITIRSNLKEYLWCSVTRISDHTSGNISEERFYNEQNEILAIKRNSYKNGLLFSSVFTNGDGQIDNLGLLESTVNSSGRKNFAKIEMFYDVNGALIECNTYYFDGKDFSVIDKQDNKTTKQRLQDELDKMENGSKTLKSAPKFV